MTTNKRLATYLNNHLAASVGALDLLASLAADENNPEIARFAAGLQAEIEAEQQAVGDLMDSLEITKNRPQQAVGWLSQKLSQVKLRFDDPDDGALYLLESLELMLIAIEGKSGLWRALAAAEVPGMSVAEYERYAAQSAEQQRRVELHRLAAARTAFST